MIFRKKHVDLWLLHHAVETKEQKQKTVAVVDYNQGNSGIDLSDQYTAVTISLPKEIKWYCKLAFEILLGIALVNSYLVFRSMLPRKIGLHQFKEEFIEKILNLPKSEQHPRPQRLKQHFLIEVQNKTSNPKRRCFGCYSKFAKQKGRDIAAKKTKKVNTFCEQCPEKPFFCLECFRKHHQN